MHRMTDRMTDVSSLTLCNLSLSLSENLIERALRYSNCQNALLASSGLHYVKSSGQLESGIT